MTSGGASPTPAAEWVAALLEESGALRHGHFLLSSGLHSPAYVQCALLLEHPARARRVGAALAAELAPYAPQSVLSPALGGVLIGHEVAAALSIPFRFCERDGDRMALRRGFEISAGERVVVVEDVVTTGKSTRETADLAVAAGAEIVAVGALIDRGGSASAPLAAPFVALLRLELAAYRPDECPLCRAGGPPEKPGSRPRPAGGGG